MKKQYEKFTIEFILFDNSDIIMASIPEEDIPLFI
jgi:hypothetical protein